MAANTLSVDNGSVTGGTRAFTKQGESLREASYIDTTTSLAEPCMLVLGQDIKAPGADGNDRHTVSWKCTRINASGRARTLSFTGTLSVPRDPVFVDGDVLDSVVNVTTLLTEARILAWADGINPNA